MAAPLDPATRPSRLSTAFLSVLVAALAMSFVTGAMIWWWQTQQTPDAPAPAWFRPAVVLHGVLFPVQCGLFGWLAGQHLRLSWEMRANVVSGFAMEAVFLGLIVSGVGLYYAGAEAWRDFWIVSHRVLGLLLPATLAAHWIAAVRWARSVAK